MSDRLLSDAIMSAAAISLFYFDQLERENIDSSSLQPIPLVKSNTAKAGWLADTKKINGLIHLVSAKINKEIHQKEFPSSDAPDINGTFIERPTNIDIFVNSHLNFCNQRFIVAKELSHILINNKHSECRISSTVKWLEVIDGMVMKGVYNDCPATQSEFYAYYAAMELLIPQRYISKILSTTSTNHEIAERLKVPEQIVELRKNSKVREIFESVYHQELFKYVKML